MAAHGESHTPANAETGAAPVRAKASLADRAQVVIALATLGALIVTIVVACQGQETVKHDSQTTLRQSLDTQLSTAITSIGSADTPEQIAGLLLLTQNTTNRFTLMGQSGEPATDVYSDYTTALQTLSGYLSSRSEQFLVGYSDQAKSPFGRGYGSPASPGLPLDIAYAADQVRVLLSKPMEKSVLSLGLGAPSLDLANDELADQAWTNINFGWISAFLVGIDLRGAYLESSQWNKHSDLQRAYLQCADLQDANFAKANLSHADLAGADVQGANFQGANLQGALLTSLYGVAKWSHQPAGITTLPVGQWNHSTCMSNSHFWRNAPAAVSPTSPVHSPGPTASATPAPSVTATATPEPSVTESPKPTVSP